MTSCDLAMVNNHRVLRKSDKREEVSQKPIDREGPSANIRAEPKCPFASQVQECGGEAEDPLNILVPHELFNKTYLSPRRKLKNEQIFRYHTYLMKYNTATSCLPT